MRSLLSALGGIVSLATASVAPAAAELNELSAFDFAFTSIDGAAMPLAAFRGRVLLIVNTASMCAFTEQYAGLQKLHETYEKRGLTVIGVPSNDFGGQEPKAEEDVKAFCQGAFGVTFPLTAKYSVRGSQAHSFYGYASTKLGSINAPMWNFHKYLIGRDGKLVSAFGAMATPESSRVVRAIEAELAKPEPVAGSAIAR